MSYADFVHLHTHTEFSLLDGMINLDDLIKKSVEYRMPVVAITDHFNLFGVVEFYLKAIEAGIKPIIGCEIYIKSESSINKSIDNDKKYYHLILLFLKGLRNNGIPAKKAEKIFETMLQSAGTASLKAQATVYAYLSYKCAYLKTHWPEEYMEALKAIKENLTCAT